MLVRKLLFLVLSMSFLDVEAASRGGDGTFEAPFSIAGPRQMGVSAIEDGDFDGDGKIDLAAASGSTAVVVYFQSPSDRQDWNHLSLQERLLIFSGKTTRTLGPPLAVKAGDSPA